MEETWNGTDRALQGCRSFEESCQNFGTSLCFSLVMESRVPIQIVEAAHLSLLPVLINTLHWHGILVSLGSYANQPYLDCQKFQCVK